MVEYGCQWDGVSNSSNEGAAQSLYWNNHIHEQNTHTITQSHIHTPTNVLDGEDDNHERFKYGEDGEVQDDLREIREHMLMLVHTHPNV